MKMSKFFGFLALAAIATTSFVGCNKEGGNGGEVEDNTVYEVFQRVEIEASEDLRSIANIRVFGRCVDGETLVSGIQYAERDVQETSALISTAPGGASIGIDSSIKENYTEGNYDLSIRATLTLELRNKAGKVLIAKNTEIEQIKNNLTVNAESVGSIGLLNGTSYIKAIDIVKNDDGSYSLVETAPM